MSRPYGHGDIGRPRGIGPGRHDQARAGPDKSAGVVWRDAAGGGDQHAMRGGSRGGAHGGDIGGGHLFELDDVEPRFDGLARFRNRRDLDAEFLFRRLPAEPRRDVRQARRRA